MVISNDKILLGHGSGGLLMKNLIDDVFYKFFEGDYLLSGDDAAVLKDLDMGSDQCIAYSTDSFVVNPIFFPGGDIGRLAICGTVNDVSTSGAIPKFISCGFILEEGFLLSDLKKICKSMTETCIEANVQIVTGDTKVVEKGKVDGVFINTSGVGLVNKSLNLSGSNCQPGDVILINGSVGDHGMTIMTSRNNMGLSSDLKSDACPLNHMIAEILNVCPEVRCFRDPTRGGLSSTLNEFALQSDVDIVVKEDSVPVSNSVKSSCELLGLDPFQVANEGKIICVCPKEYADSVLKTMKSNKYGKESAIIGEIVSKNNSSPSVYLETKYHTKRILDMIVAQQLPRIC